MSIIRLTKLSGDKLIPIISSKGNRKEKYVEGNHMEVYSSTPTVGFLFGVFDETFSFRTSRIKEILSENTFRTENSIYKWEKIK